MARSHSVFGTCRQLAGVVILGCFATSCATLDAMSVGRSDYVPANSHYVRYDRLPVAGTVVTLPVTLDPVSGEPFNLQGRQAALDPLLQALNDALRAASCCRYIDEPGLPATGAPTIYIGSVAGEYAPMYVGIEQEEYEEYPPMIAHMMKPSEAWAAAAATLAAEHDADWLILVQVAFSQYPKADKGFFGKKVVLGTNYEEEVRFLSAVDKPIEVLQLTGLLIDRNGRVVRAGAEGIAGYDTPFRVQIFDTLKDIDNNAITQVVHHDRRDDLPGRPLKWQAALDQLLHQLTR